MKANTSPGICSVTSFPFPGTLNIFYKLNELGPERWCWNLRVPMKKSGGIQMRPEGRPEIYGMCMVVL